MIAGRWKLQTPFDILQAAIASHLALWMEDTSRFCFDQDVAPALITYSFSARLMYHPIGECNCWSFHKVMLRKLGDDLSELHISDPPSIILYGKPLEDVEDDELVAWEEEGREFRLAMRGEGPIRTTSALLVQMISAARDYHNRLLNELLFKLKEDGLFRAQRDNAGVSAGEDREEETGPWEVIPEGWQRDAMKLWWEGWSQGEIAKKMGFATRTVTNRFYALRTAYTPDVVPYKNDPRRQRHIL